MLRPKEELIEVETFKKRFNNPSADGQAYIIYKLAERRHQKCHYNPSADGRAWKRAPAGNDPFHLLILRIKVPTIFLIFALLEIQAINGNKI